uniref:NR LBD domain-containing protein n=1 Tax=Caenorhabditis tropicalis TaxID=1561998 RepID=A0A1I7U1K7_9PELO
MHLSCSTSSSGTPNLEELPDKCQIYIQYDRDLFKSSSTFVKNQALAKLVEDRIGVPRTVETVLGIHHFISFVFRPNASTNLPFVDTSALCDKAITLLLNPVMIKKPRRSSNLEQLAQGLTEFQSEQKENLSEIVYMSHNDHIRDIERSMFAVANWLMRSDKIKKYDDKLKIMILQSTWFLWGRFERMVMTAKMRARKQCGKKQFVISPDALIDFEGMKSDISCWSSHTFDEMRFFFIHSELYYDKVIWDLMELQPNDVEITYLLCTICFQLVGKRFGGHVQEEIERLQDVLSNELHEYYIKNNRKIYLLRLKQLMKVKENFLRLRNIRIDKYDIGGTFNLFNMAFSNPDFFWVVV